MRYIIVATCILLFLGGSAPLNAQVNVSVSFNVASQPVWGPVGYDYVEYYYLPDIDVYYQVRGNRYYFYEKGGWIYRNSLPARYAKYDFYNSYKVVINEKYPWKKHKIHKKQFAGYKGKKDQECIRDSKDSKYFVNKNHPKYNGEIKHHKQNKSSNTTGKKDNDSKKHNKGNDKKKN